MNGLLLVRSWQFPGGAGTTVGSCMVTSPPPWRVPEYRKMRTFFGIFRSRVLSELVVFSAISACEYSVSVLVWKIFGQLCVLRQRSSWPAFTSESLSWYLPQVCGESAHGYWSSVCFVPERR